MQGGSAFGPSLPPTTSGPASPRMVRARLSPATLATPGAVTMATLRRRGIAVSVRCARRCTVALALGQGHTVLVRRRTRMTAAGSRTVTLRPGSAKMQRARAGRMTLTARVARPARSRTMRLPLRLLP